ncbi:DNA cytosine methyltransferase [Georgenia sp.]
MTDRKRAHARPFRCERCGTFVFSPVYIPEPHLRRPGERRGRHLLDWSEADRDDDQAPYANIRGDDQSSLTTPSSEPARTITTAGHQAVLQGRTVNIDDVRFRMLEPSEIKQAMAFPADYLMEGNRREQVKLSGNAVTPPAARDLIATVVSAITGEDVAA